MSSAMNHKARSRRSCAAHRSACSGHARQTIYQQTTKQQPGMFSSLRGVIKSRAREQKVDAV